MNGTLLELERPRKQDQRGTRTGGPGHRGRAAASPRLAPPLSIQDAKRRERQGAQLKPLQNGHARARSLPRPPPSQIGVQINRYIVYSSPLCLVKGGLGQRASILGNMLRKI